VNELVFAVTVAILAFGAGMVGLRLTDWLPERHAPERAREMIAAMSGLLGLLLALVLGTLVGASYTIFATQKAELETLAARTLQLDAALEAYGPEAKPARDGLRAAIKASYDKVWGGGTLGTEDLTVRSVLEGMKKLDQFLLSLSPKTDAQKQVLATASAAAGMIQQTRLLMLLQLAGGISWPMVAIVVCWSLLLFCGYGMVSPERDGRRHPRARRDRGRQRHLFDPRIEPALFRAVSLVSGRHRGDHPGPRALTARSKPADPPRLANIRR
jgi:hypothetical protein